MLLRIHGEYYRDYTLGEIGMDSNRNIFHSRIQISLKTAGHLLARVITSDERFQLLKQHVPPLVDADILTVSYMAVMNFLNKGFRFIDANDGQLTAVYNHDGRFTLLQCNRSDWEVASKLRGWKSDLPLPEQAKIDQFGTEKWS